MQRFYCMQRFHCTGHNNDAPRQFPRAQSSRIIGASELVESVEYQPCLAM